MASALREALTEKLDEYKRLLHPTNRGWRVLEVGIDGDPKPGGNYKRFGQGNLYETLDYLPRLKPNYVVDIQKARTHLGLKDEMFNLIICTQVLEHVKSPSRAIDEIYHMLKKGGYAILDSPWKYKYHPSNDYDDYWRISPSGMRFMMKNVGFKVVESSIVKKLVTVALGRKS